MGASEHTIAGVAAYVRGERDGLPLADLLRPLAAPEVVVPALLRELPGFLVAVADPALREALIARGATVRRDAETMTRALETLPAPEPPPAGLAITALGATVPPGLGAVSLAAFPPEHPDHLATSVAEAEAELRPLIEGDARWTPLAASRIARDAGGRPVGAAILSGLGKPPPFGGPWLTELCRLPDPAFRGLGGALLDAVLLAARDAGLETVGLAVTVGNPARALYARRGFTVTSRTTTLLLPA